MKFFTIRCGLSCFESVNLKMFLPDRINRITAIVDNHISVWSTEPAFFPLAQILKRDRHILIDKLQTAVDRQDPKDPKAGDATRLFLLDYTLQRCAGPITSEHFTMFREAETVQIILEDSYGISLGVERDEILIPYQSEALKIVVQCIFRGIKAADEKDVICFLHLFSSEKSRFRPDQDRTMRFRSMIWLIYLTIEIIQFEPSVCSKELEFLRKKFRDLLDHAIEGRIIDEESRRPGFEGGKWESSLFGWLQGEDRREFAQKLRRQFNLENKIEHANRFLLAEHRKCVFEQVLTRFCS